MPEPKPTPRPDRRPLSMLDTLMRDTLDQGYAEAARRRAEAPPVDEPTARAQARRRARAERVLGAGGALLVGLLLVVAWMQTNRSAPADARVRSDLRHRVVTAEHDNSGLVSSVRALQSSVDALGTAALGPGDTRRLRAAELAAGTTAVQGEGLRVVIGNPPVSASATATGGRGSTGTSSVPLLTDTDVRAVVNELWSAGAEAIAVDDVRLSPTSAIRFAGQAVLVDFRPVAAPYSIAAVGPADALNTYFTSSPVADRFRTLSSAYRFEFTISQEGSVKLPASTGGGPRYARTPAPTATPTTATPTVTPSTPAPTS
jgi:uncharacterized protein YlxW (UPF0749 family)